MGLRKIYDSYIYLYHSYCGNEMMKNHKKKKKNTNHPNTRKQRKQNTHTHKYKCKRCCHKIIRLPVSDFKDKTKEKLPTRNREKERQAQRQTDRQKRQNSKLTCLQRLRSRRRRHHCCSNNCYNKSAQHIFILFHIDCNLFARISGVSHSSWPKYVCVNSLKAVHVYVCFIQVVVFIHCSMNILNSRYASGQISWLFMSGKLNYFNHISTSDDILAV